MLLKIIRFLRGSVDFTASGKFPERFMNITAKNGVNRVALLFASLVDIGNQRLKVALLH